MPGQILFNMVWGGRGSEKTQKCSSSMIPRDQTYDCYLPIKLKQYVENSQNHFLVLSTLLFWVEVVKLAFVLGGYPAKIWLVIFFLYNFFFSSISFFEKENEEIRK